MLIRERESEIGEQIVRSDVFVVSMENASVTMTLKGQEYSTHNLSSLGYPDFALIARGDVYDPPITHENSSSRYVIDRYEGNDRILFGGLEPGNSTSTHSHPKNPFMPEFYFVYQGTLHMYLENGLYKRDFLLSGNPSNPATYIVTPGIRHHAVAEGDRPALWFLRMSQAALIPPHFQHLQQV